MTRRGGAEVALRRVRIERPFGHQQRRARAEASADPARGFALEYFVYRVGLNAGMLAAALGGLDAFVFTAGIGENSPAMRARIAEKLAWLGADARSRGECGGRHVDIARRIAASGSTSFRPMRN